MVSSYVTKRILTGIRYFYPILIAAKSNDINEADTSVIIADMLSDIFGYDKYSEITSELCIRGTYCDLAIKIDDEIRAIVEVKAIGSELKEAHTRQAVNYAANQGVDWVILTNSLVWYIYKITFGKPIGQDLVAEIDIDKFDPKDSNCLNSIFLLAKEAWGKSVLSKFYAQKQALSRFSIAAITLSDPVLKTICRELKRACPGVKIDKEQIKKVLLNELIKREVLEDDKVAGARKRIRRRINRALQLKNEQNKKISATV